MKQIGLYQTTSDFSTQDAGTAEWCTAERDGKRYFIKKFHTPVYPSKEIGLPEKMYKAGVEEFHAARKKLSTPAGKRSDRRAGRAAGSI